MPRTRSDVNRVDKINEILDAAERQLLAGGYAELSMVATARELNVAQNAVYWYFPTKDHLFVAVLDRLQAKVLARKPPASRGLAEQGRTIVVVEQNVVAALSFSHRCYVLNNGHIVYEGTPAELHGAQDIVQRYLGVGAHV